MTLSRTTYSDRVRAAQSHQEALLAIAEGLDEVLAQLGEQAPAIADAWPAWHIANELEADSPGVKIEGDEERTEVTIPPPSDEKLQRRREFEQQYLRLAEHLGDGQDWTEAYAKGGPMWLYLGNRELTVSYPDDVRAALIQDVLEDSPQDAHEMGRDLLKQAGESGPGSPAMMIGTGNVG